jgi:hypothetical protein
VPGTAFIGLDFGSSLIKLAIRLEDVGLANDGRRGVFGVAFDGATHATPYRVFLETAIWNVGDGPDRRVFLRPPSRGAPPKSIGIKERLIDGYRPGEHLRLSTPIEPCGLTPEEATVLLLASTLEDARAAIRHYVRDRGARTPASFLVNCAIPSSDTLKTDTQDALLPSSCPHRNRFRDLVERVRRYIFVEQRSLPANDMTLTKARNTAASILGIALPDDEGALGTACLPESLAAILAATTHPRFREGLHFVFDIGAFTTDASLFHFNPNPLHQFMNYYATGTCRAGVGRDAIPGRSLRPEHLNLLRNETQALYLQMIRDMLDAYPRDFERAMFAHEPTTWTPKWRATIIGGGAKIGEVPGMIAQLRGRPRHGGDGFPARMSAPPTPFPEDTYERIVFINGIGASRTKSITLLRSERRHYDNALRVPSHILQMSIGLTRNVLDCPPWSASTPPTPSNGANAQGAESWRDYNPWTGL